MTTIRALTLMLAVGALACGGGDDGVDYTPAIDSGASAGIDAATCGAAKLCMRSIDECDVDLSQASCEAWYAEPGNCANMAAYTVCNCQCIDQATCDEYFACGEICFADHCD